MDAAACEQAGLFDDGVGHFLETIDGMLGQA
jgi:hypothetical protein